MIYLQISLYSISCNVHRKNLELSRFYYRDSMPPKGIKEQRVLCPLCSKEIAAGYKWLHKKQYCSMRPGRQEEINAEAMGITKFPGQGDGQSATSNPPAQDGILKFNNQFSNIIPINLEQEYADMVKVMKKKQEEEEEEYQCGGCKATFNARKEPRHCPECGVAF